MVSLNRDIIQLKMKKDITIIIGPTGIGKSDFAIDLACKTKAEIISADAYQVYKYMDIGTAKVSKEERKLVPHHLIDIKEPDESYSVAEFVQLTNKVIANMRKKQKPIIICGGTGFFVKAFLYNYEFPDFGATKQIRDKLYEELANTSNQEMWTKLSKIDPKSAEIIDPQNTKRIIRALEIFEQTKTNPSSLRKKSEQPRQDTKIICLTSQRENVVKRIENRADNMIELGFIEEVKSLLNKGYKTGLQSFEAIGYKEIINFLHGSITKKEMLELIKTRTRQFSKRQMTWFKKFENIIWHEIS
jgi:tRNA dimethylallyltransferase